MVVSRMLSVTTLESMPTFGNTPSGSVWFVLLPMMLFNFGVAFLSALATR